ncbi:MAG: hypothetical protein L0216_15525 [Planctomycetales bacterium]|nr:hypothetical protein [Planctomycetales bacterium]
MADARGDVHRLEDRGAVLALVSLRETKAPKNRWRVKSCVSFLYFGAARQRSLERSRKQWVVKTRRFPDRAAAEAHAGRKREEILRFVRAREKATAGK